MSRLIWVMVVMSGCGGPVRTELVIPDGRLMGTLSGDTRGFLGVPFAQPPLGERRFAAPVQNAGWGDLRQAVAQPPGCAQLLIDQSAQLEGSSEDCLYLNVFTPKAPRERLPVMLFFPGGAFVFGSANEPLYEGSKLSAAGDVVVVVANYRLGPFGFAAHPALAAQNPSGTSGNWGLLDQREAMRWVQRNIEAFGGDPQRVTIFGESAGAGSVCMHLLSEASAGLFQRAILQSTPCAAFLLPTRLQSEAQGVAMATALGCTGSAPEIVSCLRARSEAEVLRALPLDRNVVFGEGVSWGPSVDGVMVRDEPLQLLAQGRTLPVPVLVGANADEGSLFLSKVKDLKTEADLRLALSDLFAPPVVDAAIARYGLAPSAKESGEKILSDVFFCSSRRVGRAHAATGQPVYRYYFARKYFDFVLGLGAFHGAELPFIFGNDLNRLGVQAPGRPLQRAMQGYWTTFARTGDPNGGERATWPRYQQAGDVVLRLDVPLGEETELRTQACDFWDSQLKFGLQ